MTTIYLDKPQVPRMLIGSYTGNKFEVKVTDKSVDVATDAHWSGGSRSTFRMVELATGREMDLSDPALVGDGLSPKALKVHMRPGYVVREHTIFMGKDLGLTFHVHPVDAAPLLPKPQDLDNAQMIVLVAAGSLKSSYGGLSRKQMACRDTGLSSADYDKAFTEMQDRKYLDKRGAITTAGKNVSGNKSLYDLKVK